MLGRWKELKGPRAALSCVDPKWHAGRSLPLATGLRGWAVKEPWAVLIARMLRSARCVTGLDSSPVNAGRLRAVLVRSGRDEDGDRLGVGPPGCGDLRAGGLVALEVGNVGSAPVDDLLAHRPRAELGG